MRIVKSKLEFETAFAVQFERDYGVKSFGSIEIQRVSFTVAVFHKSQKHFGLFDSRKPRGLRPSMPLILGWHRIFEQRLSLCNCRLAIFQDHESIRHGLKVIHQKRNKTRQHSSTTLGVNT